MATGKEMLLVIPAPGFGHLQSILELVKKLLRHSNNRFSVTFLIINLPYGNEKDLVKKLSCSNPDINFVDVPAPDSVPQVSSGPAGGFLLSYINSHKQNVAEVVKKVVSKNDRICFIVDMFCGSMVDVANQFEAGCYSYFISGAAFVGFCRFIADRTEAVELEEPDLLISSYATPVPTSVLPRFAVMKDEYADYSNNFKRLAEMKGIITNTFAELEHYALRSLSDAEGYPPVYPVGPVSDLSKANRVVNMNEVDIARIMNWLDEQEEESVVFLCFGREGCFRADQVKEIALGLELSGVKFLWALRKPSEAPSLKGTDDLSELLPEGFLSRIEGRGMICGWAPQLEILDHPAVGGFVTHCGWQSSLESIWFGVPTATWPLYAEQQINALLMVKDLKLSVEIKMDYKIMQEELVPASVIQNAIKGLIDKECNVSKEMRARVKEMSKISKTVQTEGGSSFETIERLVADMSSI